AVGEVDDGEAAATAKVAEEVGLRLLAQAGPLPVDVVLDYDVVGEQVAAVEEVGAVDDADAEALGLLEDFLGGRAGGPPVVGWDWWGAWGGAWGGGREGGKGAWGPGRISGGMGRLAADGAAAGQRDNEADSSTRAGASMNRPSIRHLRGSDSTNANGGGGAC